MEEQVSGVLFLIVSLAMELLFELIQARVAGLGSEGLHCQACVRGRQVENAFHWAFSKFIQKMRKTSNESISSSLK